MSEKPSPKPSGLSPNFDLGKSLAEATEDIDTVVYTEAVAAAHRVSEEINNDDLTGLLNKKAFRKKLDEALLVEGDKAVLFIDLTNLKRINDESPLRHEAGDKALSEVASVLSKLFRTSKNDALAHERHIDPEGEAGRVGGDEFAVLLDLTPREEEWKQKKPTERMTAVIDRLREEFAILKNDNPQLTDYGFDVAIGGAVWENGMDASTLLTNADYAMSQDKFNQHAVNGKYR